MDTQDTQRERELSAPEIPAEAEEGGAVLGAVVYFSSASENTSRFIKNCHLEKQGINVYRIPLRPKEPALNVDEPYILVVPTYGGGNPKKAVPVQVKKFLNDPANRAGIQGVIASGNTNFGEAFCAAGDMISAKCKVPFMYYFELMGTQQDREKVTRGVVDFFTRRKTAQANTAQS
ncbi:class Ib ribonucleoside-diphosphate reductase assembly flavoprotein NrdI [Alloscardovia macacae]|nr:class Ib ribonucleoside-diphosphate reductase assembly flavoprotein NrdI [Alloscardovia macacae]